MKRIHYRSLIFCTMAVTLLAVASAEAGLRPTLTLPATQTYFAPTLQILAQVTSRADYSFGWELRGPTRGHFRERKTAHDGTRRIPITIQNVRPGSYSLVVVVNSRLGEAKRTIRFRVVAQPRATSIVPTLTAPIVRGRVGEYKGFALTATYAPARNGNYYAEFADWRNISFDRRQFNGDRAQTYVRLNLPPTGTRTFKARACNRSDNRCTPWATTQVRFMTSAVPGGNPTTSLLPTVVAANGPNRVELRNGQGDFYMDIRARAGSNGLSRYEVYWRPGLTTSGDIRNGRARDVRHFEGVNPGVTWNPRVRVRDTSGNWSQWRNASPIQLVRGADIAIQGRMTVPSTYTVHYNRVQIDIPMSLSANGNIWEYRLKWNGMTAFTQRANNRNSFNDRFRFTRERINGVPSIEFVLQAKVYGGDWQDVDRKTVRLQYPNNNANNDANAPVIHVQGSMSPNNVRKGQMVTCSVRYNSDTNNVVELRYKLGHEGIWKSTPFQVHRKSGLGQFRVAIPGNARSGDYYFEGFVKDSRGNRSRAFRTQYYIVQ